MSRSEIPPRNMTHTHQRTKRFFWTLGILTGWALFFSLFPTTQLTPRHPDSKPSNVYLFDFSNDEIASEWKTTSDRVTGGKSKAKIRATSRDTGLFSGKLAPHSHHNFCLSYSPIVKFQLRSFGGLLLRIRGDGKHYRIRIYNQTDIHGVYFQAGFDTRKNRLMTVFLPFSSFIPWLKNKMVRDWPILDQSRIKRIGLSISDQPAGPFHLEIFWIKAKEY